MLIKLRSLFISAFSLMLFVHFLNGQSLNEQFVSLENDEFTLGCEPFYPMIMNYPLKIEESNSGEYRLAPYMKYCYKYNDWLYSCGASYTNYRDTIVDHLRAIDSMGFNTIRVVRLSVRADTTISGLDTTAFLQSPDYYEQGQDPNIHQGGNRFELNDTTQFAIIGDALDTLFNILRTESINLKVIVVAGAHGLELAGDKYAEYLAYMARRFIDVPLLFAWDLYNEPSFSKIVKPSSYTKYQTATWFSQWDSAVKQNTFTQYVTYGPALEDIFYWDPEVIKTDFVAYHTYSHSKASYNWDHDTAFLAYRAYLKYANDILTRPWILGETGYPGIDTVTHPLNKIIHPVVGTETQQKAYIEKIVKYMDWFDIQGYAHWDFKDDIYDTAKINTLGVKPYFKGLVRFTDPDNYNWKQAAAIYQHFDSISNCTGCSDPPAAEYFNASFYEYLVDSACVIDSITGDPISNALIIAQLGIQDTSDFNHQFITFSDTLGAFSIRKMLDNNNIIIKRLRVTAPFYSTYQFSIWDSKLSGDTIRLMKIDTALLPTAVQYNPLHIKPGDTVSWDMPRLVTGNLVVDSSAQLTIKSKVYFNGLKKLIVKRGGALILDSAVLTNNGNCMWKGIEVWGTRNHPPDSIHSHGKVTLKNNALIEHAEIGIRTVKMSESQGVGGSGESSPDYSYSGGKVSVQSGSEFRNCKIGVKFYPYSYDHASGFTNTTFRTTDSLLTSTGIPNAGVVLSQVQDIDFLGCTFINSSDSGTFETEDLGTGIYSLESEFRINEYCPAATPPCADSALILSRFENLCIGVDTRFTTSNKFADIRNAEFIDNWRGLYASAMTNGRITSNYFEINQPFEEDGGCGLYLDNCTGYWVEENTFEHIGDSTTVGIGLVVHNSGTDPNEIYRNTFTNLEQGISAQEQNRSARQGLQILCNDFDECLADVFVAESVYEGRGIAPSQGVNDTIAEAMAGNLFYIESPVCDSSWDDLNNEATHFYYYCPQNYAFGYLRVVPVDFTYNTITEVDKQIKPNDWTFDDGCPSQTSIGGGTKSSGLDYKEELIYYTGRIGSIESTLQELIDGGNTQFLNTEVELSTPPETMDLYNQLLNESPFVSEKVVETSIEKENVLPNAMIRDVMVSNPHSATSGTLLDMLDERNNPMPDYMKSQVIEARETQTLKTELESKLAGLKLKRARALNGLAREYLTDTINPLLLSDSLESLFQSVNDRNIKYRLAMLHLQRGEYAKGNTVLNAVPISFQLNNLDLIEHNKVVDYFNIIKGIYQDGRTEFEVIETEVQQLLNLEVTSVGINGAYARNILLELDEIDYSAPIQLPDIYKSSKEIQQFVNILNSEPQSQISVFPNPSKDYVVIQYDLEFTKHGIIEIKDVNGKLIGKIVLNEIEDQVTLNTQGWKPGLYIATLIINGRWKESCKFTIIN